VTLLVGEKAGSPCWFEIEQERLRREQQKLSRKEKKGPDGPSNNRERQRKRVVKATSIFRIAARTSSRSRPHGPSNTST